MHEYVCMVKKSIGLGGKGPTQRKKALYKETKGPLHGFVSREEPG